MLTFKCIHCKECTVKLLTLNLLLKYCKSVVAYQGCMICTNNFTGLKNLVLLYSVGKLNWKSTVKLALFLHFRNTILHSEFTIVLQYVYSYCNFKFVLFNA